MRIVQCVTLASSDGAFGGPLSVAMQQCRELARLGHHVTLLAGWDGELQLEVPGTRVILARARRIAGAGFSGIYAPQLSRWLRRNRASVDIVHVHLGRHLVDLTVAKTAQDLGLPVVVQTHGMVMPDSRPAVSLLDGVFTRRVLRRAEAVLTLSEEETAGVRQVQPAATIRPVQNGVAPVERERKSAVGDHEVLFLSRLHPRKRVMAFAEASLQIVTRHPSARFSVVGPDEGDLDQLNKFMARHSELPMRYEGSVPPGEGSRRIAEADVFVLPSVGEVFPMALLEALAAGTPVVMNADCAIAPALERTGAALVTDGTPGALASAVARLLEDPSLRASMQAAGRKMVEGEFGSRAVALDLENLYQSAPGA